MFENAKRLHCALIKRTKGERERLGVSFNPLLRGCCRNTIARIGVQDILRPQFSLALRQVDLLKADIIGEISSSSRHTDEWEDIEEGMGDEEFHAAIQSHLHD